VFSVLGNALYCSSIFVGYLCHHNGQKLIDQIPYLVGSGGTLIFDFFVRLIEFLWLLTYADFWAVFCLQESRPCPTCQ
jgi:hypothetical protein